MITVAAVEYICEFLSHENHDFRLDYHINKVTHSMRDCFEPFMSMSWKILPIQTDLSLQIANSLRQRNFPSIVDSFTNEQRNKHSFVRDLHDLAKEKLFIEQEGVVSFFFSRSIKCNLSILFTIVAIIIQRANIRQNTGHL